MTATADMAGHPDVTEISDLAEGLLPPARTTSVRQHLDECSSCTEVLQSLEEIRELLGAVPALPAMPTDVAAGINAALAAEARTAAENQASAVDAQGDDRAHVSRETSLPTTTSISRPSGRPRATTGPGRRSRVSPDRSAPDRSAPDRSAPDRSAPDRGARARRRAMALGTVCTVVALGVGVLLVQSLTGDGSQETAQTRASDTFSGRPLDSQVDALLGASSKVSDTPFTPESGPHTRGSIGMNPLQTRSVPVPECIREGLKRGDALAAKEGVYLDRKAYLVVLPDAANDTRVMAYVVDATCIDQPSVGAGKVMAQRSYAKP